MDAYYGYPGEIVYTDEKRSHSTAQTLAEQQFGKRFIAAADRLRHQIARPAPDAQSKIYFCHGFCELGAIDAESALRDVDAFLEQNPDQVVAIVIEDYVDPADMSDVIKQAGLANHVYTGPTGPGQWPTLREMIESDQRLVVMAEHKHKGGAPWYHPAYGHGLVKETPYDFKKPEQMTCAPNRGAEGDPLFLINNWISTDPAPKPSNAAVVNAHDFLLNRAHQCERQRGAFPSLIAVNFYQQGDLINVVKQLNEEGPIGAAKSGG